MFASLLEQQSMALTTMAFMVPLKEKLITWQTAGTNRVKYCGASIQNEQ
jgi:hypothetical protein